MNPIRLYLLLFFTVATFLPIKAQLNAPEHIMLDTFSSYPAYGYETGDGCLIAGEEGSCNTATLWLFDKNFDQVKKKYLIHDYYEISQIYDLKMNEDSSVQVLTRQLEIEDVVSDTGVKWYTLSKDLEIKDSVYLTSFPTRNGFFIDSSWVFSTWEGTLVFISAETHKQTHEIKFDNGYNDIVKSGSSIVSWHDSLLLTIDSAFQPHTLLMGEDILDMAANQHDVYVLTRDSILRLNTDNQFQSHGGTKAPMGADQLFYNSTLNQLVVTTRENTIYYLEPGSLKEVNKVQLFYNPSNIEDLNYTGLADGSILRIGTTQVKMKNTSGSYDGQQMGFLQRFDKNYVEDGNKRSDLSLASLSITDQYYGSEPRYILGDSVYIITTDGVTKINWQFKNSGTDTIHTAFTSTNQVFGFNCAEGFYTQLLKTALEPGASTGKEFEFYKDPLISNGYRATYMVYTAYPNGHYDANFSDNVKNFGFKYILSGIDRALDPGKITIFPNPADNVVHVSTNGEIGIQKVEITDLQGRKIFQEPVEIENTSVDIITGTLASGTYLLRVQTSKGNTIKKIMIVR